VVAGGALSVFELAGVFGALLSGTLSDLIGRKPVLMTGLVAAPLLTLIFLEVEGPWRVAVLLALGFTGLSTGPVMLAIVQEHLPSHRALANGLFLSMVFLTRPPGVVIAGFIGDHWGLETTFLCRDRVPDGRASCDVTAVS
jgi:FSR family fosmidomycin resistance protein-like MFS transporter